VYKNAKEILENINNNEIIKFISVTTDYIVDILDTMEDILMKDLANGISNTYFPLLYVLFILGIIVDSIIFKFLIKEYIKIRFTQIDELLYIIFFVPENIISISPKFKRYLETCEFES